MKRLFNKLIVFNPKFTEHEADRRLKYIFLTKLYFLSGLISLIMGFVRLQQSIILGMIEFGFCALSISLLYYLRNNKDKIEIMASVALILTYILFFLVYLLAPYNTMRLSLFFLLTAAASFLKGRSVGLAWMIFILVSIILGHYFFANTTGYSTTDIFTTSLYLIVFYFIFDNYEMIKEEQSVYLAELNSRLEKEVKERTKELELANTALEIEKQAFKDLSFTDQLTGLYNRHKLQVIFEFEKEQILRYKSKLSVILIDLDYFKSINDQYGHIVGDSALKEFALIIKNSVRGSDIVARWGGEEFIIVAPNTSLAQIVQLAEHLRQRVNSITFPVIGHITASFGVTTFEHNDTLEKIIQRADHALYLAKESGRDNVKAMINYE